MQRSKQPFPELLLSLGVQESWVSKNPGWFFLLKNPGGWFNDWVFIWNDLSLLNLVVGSVELGSRFYNEYSTWDLMGIYHWLLVLLNIKVFFLHFKSISNQEISFERGICQPAGTNLRGFWYNASGWDDMKWTDSKIKHVRWKAFFVHEVGIDWMYNTSTYIIHGYTYVIHAEIYVIQVGED